LVSIRIPGLRVNEMRKGSRDYRWRMETMDQMKKRASALLVEALGLLDEAGETEAVIRVSEAIDALVGASEAFDQWLILTNRQADIGTVH
jgi:hypothetical protein